MSNFANDIRDAVGDEEIVGIAIGAFGWDGFREEDIERKAEVRRGVVLTWGEAEPMLDYEYHVGYGSPECDAICLWTPTRVIWVTQYDGSTHFSSAPRNPIDHMPDMPGG